MKRKRREVRECQTCAHGVYTPMYVGSNPHKWGRLFCHRRKRARRVAARETCPLWASAVEVLNRVIDKTQCKPEEGEGK